MIAWPSRRVWQIVLGIYGVALMVATHWPGAQVNVIPGLRLDLFVHVGAYAALAGLIALAGAGASLPPAPATILVAAIGLAWASLDEATQAIPILRRTFDAHDLVADAAGVAIGSVAGVLLARRRPKAGQESSR